MGFRLPASLVDALRDDAAAPALAPSGRPRSILTRRPGDPATAAEAAGLAARDEGASARHLAAGNRRFLDGASALAINARDAIAETDSQLAALRADPAAAIEPPLARLDVLAALQASLTAGFADDEADARAGLEATGAMLAAAIEPTLAGRQAEAARLDARHRARTVEDVLVELARRDPFRVTALVEVGQVFVAATPGLAPERAAPAFDALNRKIVAGAVDGLAEQTGAAEAGAMIADGRFPLPLAADETAAVTAELDTRAAEEATAAEARDRRERAGVVRDTRVAIATGGASEAAIRGAVEAGGLAPAAAVALTDAQVAARQRAAARENALARIDRILAAEETGADRAAGPPAMDDLDAYYRDVIVPDVDGLDPAARRAHFAAFTEGVGAVPPALAADAAIRLRAGAPEDRAEAARDLVMLADLDVPGATIDPTDAAQARAVVRALDAGATVEVALAEGEAARASADAEAAAAPVPRPPAGFAATVNEPVDAAFDLADPFAPPLAVSPSDSGGTDVATDTAGNPITLAVPRTGDPWRDGSLSRHQRAEVTALLDDILAIEPGQDIEALEVRIERVTALWPGLGVDLIQAARNLAGAQPEADAITPFGNADAVAGRRRVVELQRRLAAAELLDERMAETAADFTAFEAKTGLQMRPMVDGHVAAFVGDADRALFVVDAGIARVLAENHEDAGEDLDLLFAFLKGEIGRDEYLRRVETFVVNFGPAVGVIADDILDTDVRDALRAALVQLDDGFDPGIAVEAFAALRFKEATGLQTLLGFLADVTPIIGNLRSAGYAIDGFVELAEKLHEGDLVGAANAGLFAFVDTIGAIPWVGTLLQPAFKTLKPLLRNALESRGHFVRRTSKFAEEKRAPTEDIVIAQIFGQNWFERLTTAEKNRVRGFVRMRLGPLAAEHYIEARLRGFGPGFRRTSRKEVRFDTKGGHSRVDIITVRERDLEILEEALKKDPSEIAAALPKDVKIIEVKTGSAKLKDRQKEVRQAMIDAGRGDDFLYLALPIEEIPKDDLITIARQFAAKGGEKDFPPQFVDALADRL